MTREERDKVIEIIEKEEAYMLSHGGDTQAKAFRIAINELKQESKTDALDKIKAEIIELRSRHNVGVLECLDIIDKYKAESEK